MTDAAVVATNKPSLALSFFLSFLFTGHSGISKHGTVFTKLRQQLVGVEKSRGTFFITGWMDGL